MKLNEGMWDRVMQMINQLLRRLKAGDNKSIYVSTNIGFEYVRETGWQWRGEG